MFNIWKKEMRLIKNITLSDFIDWILIDKLN